MRRADHIYGYLFRVITQKANDSWVAYCPGVGGVYEEGDTEQEAIANAYEAACAVFEARAKTGHLLTENGPYLRVLYEPPRISVLQTERESADSFVATVSC